MENIKLANVTTPSVLIDHDVPLWTSYTLIGCLVCIAIVGIPGNVTVLAVINNIREKSSTDYFVLSMSFIDFYSAFVNTVCYILRYEATIWISLSSITFCRLHVFSIGFTNITTTLLLGATAYDRYRRTSSNSIKDTLSASTTARRVSMGIILSGLTYSLFFLFTTTYEQATRTCSRADGYKMIASIFSGIIALVFISMFLLVIVCYTKVAIILHQHHKTMTKKKTYTLGYNVNKNTTITDTPPGTRSTGDTKKLKSDNKPPKHCFYSLEVPHSSNKESLNTEENKQTLVSVIEITNNERINTDKSQVIDFTKSYQRNPSYPQSSQQRIIASDEGSSERRRKMVNHTTLMMFFITLIYVTTWVVNWTVSIYGLVTNSLSEPVVFLGEKVFMINCMTNPLFYIMMSSKFRHKAKALFCDASSCVK